MGDEFILIHTVKELEDLLMAVNPREAIMGLQTRMAGMNQEDFPVIHYHAPGQYAREIFLRANRLIVGKIHKHAHINTISMGECIVVTEFGIQRIKAPKTFVSKPGTKRALVTLKDTIWTTYHVTDKTDLAEIEEDIIAKTYAEYDELAFRRNLSQAIGSVDAPVTIMEEES